MGRNEVLNLAGENSRRDSNRDVWDSNWGCIAIHNGNPGKKRRGACMGFASKALRTDA